jgi:hypothetical protein
MNIMVRVKSYKYGLGGEYKVEKLTGTFYKFTKDEQIVFVPESDIGNVEGFSEGKNMPTVKSYKYGLGGEYKVEKLTGTIYKFTKGRQTVFVPESDIGNIEGFSSGNTKTNVKKLNDNFGEMIGIYHKYTNLSPFVWLAQKEKMFLDVPYSLFLFQAQATYLVAIVLLFV